MPSGRSILSANLVPTRPRILIVDDEPTILSMLQMAFRGRDWHVEVSVSAEVAWERHRAAPFNLMIVDKNLPDMDGVTLMRKIRREDPRVRLIMITGYASVESAVETVNVGIDAYLEKPFDHIRDVAKVVEQTLAKQRTQVQTRIASSLVLDTGAFAALSDSGAHTAVDDSASGDSGASDQGKPAVAIRTEDLPLTILLAVADRSTMQQMFGGIAAVQDTVLCAVDMAEVMANLESEPDVVLLHGKFAVVATVNRVRAVAPNMPLIVVAETLDIRAAKALIGLGVNALVNAPGGQVPSHKPIKRLLRTVRALANAGRRSTRR